MYEWNNIIKINSKFSFLLTFVTRLTKKKYEECRLRCPINLKSKYKKFFI